MAVFRFAIVGNSTVMRTHSAMELRLDFWLSGLLIPQTAEQHASSTHFFFIRGETEIGSITFYISVSLNNTDVKSQITELAPLISRELHVNILQVHLLNVTSEGNDYITKWSVTPPKPAESMSNTTASNIISRIADGGIHLPASYGNYHLSNWNTHPPLKRSWRQKYYMIAVVVSMAMLVVGLSGVGTWWFWRRRQQSSLQYKPVDSMVVADAGLRV